MRWRNTFGKVHVLRDEVRVGNLCCLKSKQKRVSLFFGMKDVRMTKETHAGFESLASLEPSDPSSLVES